MNFAQIGSAPNVQQVGEGTAYVQDKYENPLLSVGKMSMSLASAKAKAKAAEDKAAKAGKTELIKLDNVGASHLGMANDVLGTLQQVHNKENTPESQQYVSRGMNTFNNIASVSRDLNKQIDETKGKVRDLSAKGNVSTRVFDQLTNDHYKKGREIYQTATDKVQGMATAVESDASVHPDSILAASLKLSDADIASDAQKLGQQIHKDFKGINPVGNGYQQAVSNETKKTIKSSIDTYVNNNYTATPVVNRYMDMFYEHPNDKSVSKYLTSTPKNGFVEVGKDLYLNKDAYIKDKLREETISKLSESDKDLVSHLQDYQSGSWGGGLGAGKDSKIIIEPSTGINNQGAGWFKDESGRAELRNVQIFNPGGFTVTSTSPIGNIVSLDNANVTRFSDKADKHSIEEKTTGKLTVNYISSAFMRKGENGKLTPEVSFHFDKNATKEEMAEKILKATNGDLSKISLGIGAFGKMLEKDNKIYTGDIGQGDGLAIGIKESETPFATQLTEPILNQLKGKGKLDKSLSIDSFKDEEYNKKLAALNLAKQQIASGSFKPKTYGAKGQTGGASKAGKKIVPGF